MYISLFFCVIIFSVRGEDLSQSIEFERQNSNESLTRFEALFKCKQDLEGSFASSYYLDNEASRAWIYDVIASNPKAGLKFHRDLFNDSSYLVI